MDALNQLIKECIEYNLTNVHTAFPGSVEKYDAKTRRADIQPYLKRKMPGGNYMNFPVIPDVPVLFFGTKKFTIHAPLEKDDEVLVIICERATDKWRDSGGKEVEDSDPRRFNLMDCFAIPGLQPQDFIPATEDGLQIIHKDKPDGELISQVLMTDDKIEAIYKKKAKAVMEDDKIECVTDKKNKVVMTKNNIDVESPNPIGINGTSTQLGADTLQIFFDEIIKAVTRNPVLIPPVPLPPGAPVPPVPPLINMHLKGVWTDIEAACRKAKAACAKALK